MSHLATYIPSDMRERLVAHFQDTDDIIELLLVCELQAQRYAPILRKYFLCDDPYQTCKRIWYFMKQNIAYQREPGSRQTGKTIGRILRDRYGDCKAFATFAVACCRACGIPACFRMASYDGAKIPTHVYCVAKCNGKIVVIDGVLNRFDDEARYTYFRNEKPLPIKKF